MDSLKKRYFYKLSTNIFGLAISIVTAGVIPRGLGPKAYGDFNFLTNFFNQIVGFLDMGTGQCFYTKLSQRQEEKKLVNFYFYFIGIVFLIVIGFVMLIHFSSFYIKVLPDQKIFYIYLAAGVAFFAWFMQILNQMTDAYGLTVSSELMRLLQKALGLGIILLLYFFHQLNLSNFFYYQYFLIFFLCITFVFILKKNSNSLFSKEKISSENTKSYIKEFYQYSYPIFFYSLLCLVANIFDRWLLQVYGGSIQQGFFGLSYQISAICFLFTGAMTPLLTREFSVSFAKQDLQQMAVLFQRYIPLFYSITAYFSCFAVLQAQKVVYIFGGKNYNSALLVVIIMAFFPIHQTYGQLSSSVFFATGQTKLYTKVGILFSVIGIPITYFLIAPASKMGLNAGAAGLAVKMVLLQFISANVMLYFNSRLLKISFWKLFRQQIFSVVLLLVLAYLATFSIDSLSGLHGKMIPSFLLSGVLYTLMVFGLAYYLPQVFGLKKQDFNIFKLLKIG